MRAKRRIDPGAIRTNARILVDSLATHATDLLGIDRSVAAVDKAALAIVDAALEGDGTRTIKPAESSHARHLGRTRSRASEGDTARRPRDSSRGLRLLRSRLVGGYSLRPTPVSPSSSLVWRVTMTCTWKRLSCPPLVPSGSFVPSQSSPVSWATVLIPDPM
jgi:hypothetical protein